MSYRDDIRTLEIENIDQPDTKVWGQLIHSVQQHHKEATQYTVRFRCSTDGRTSTKRYHCGRQKGGGKRSKCPKCGYIRWGEVVSVELNRYRWGKNGYLETLTFETNSELHTASFPYLIAEAEKVDAWFKEYDRKQAAKEA